MPYSLYTWAQLRSEVRTLISDPAGVYWTDEELLFALSDVFREWSVLTTYWRARGTFPIISPYVSDPPTRFYDLSINLPALRPRTVTINSLVREMQYILYEPVSGIAGTGMTQQFSVTELIDSILRARNRLLLDCQIPLTYTPALPVVAGDGFVEMDSTTLFIQRAAWATPDLRTYSALRLTDEFAAHSILALNAPGTPVGYSQLSTLPIQLQLYPSPQSDGRLELLTANSLGILSASVLVGTTLGIPDDFTPAVKYAALADLLSMDGESADPFRSQYFDTRYKNFISMAAGYRSALTVKVNSTSVPLGTLYALDCNRPFWGGVTGMAHAAAAVFDFLTIYPLPRSSGSCDVLVAQSAPLPTSDASIIQIGTEELNNVLDAMQHYLSVKMGGVELSSTFSQYDGFLKQGMRYNAKLSASIRYLSAAMDRPLMDASYYGTSVPIGPPDGTTSTSTSTSTSTTTSVPTATNEG